MQAPIRVDTQEVWRGHTIRLTVEHIVDAQGQRRTMDVVRHPGAAAVVPLDEDGCVRLVRQWRQPPGDFLLEIPAGRCDAGESRQQAAIRELREEVGVEAARWTPLGAVLASPGFCDEEISLYLAEGLTFVGTRPDEGEVIEEVRMPWDEVRARAHGGDFRDAKTICGLLRAVEVLSRRQREGSPG